jgi:hypothetical protein
MPIPVLAAHKPPAIGPLPITSPELLEELDELELEELELELLEELELLDELELELLEELDELELLLLEDEPPDEPVPPQLASIRLSNRQARGLKDVP